MTDDLAVRLLAAIEDTERLARDAEEVDGGEWTSHVGPPRVEVRGERGYVIASALFTTVAPHIARHGPKSTLARCAVDRETLSEYATTVRLRDEAADRLRAQGEHKDRSDLDYWCRADTEASILLPVIERLARSYDLNTEAATDG